MTKLKTTAIVACLLVGFAAAVLSAVNMQEGNWEMNVQTEMKGMPFKMPAVKYTVCLTKDNMTPQNTSKDCRLISSKIVGSTYTWVMECNTDKGPMKSSGTATYKGATMDAVVNVATGGMNMTQTMNGRRTGPCSK